MDNRALTEKYQLILEKRVDPNPEEPEAFTKFLENWCLHRDLNSEPTA